MNPMIQWLFLVAPIGSIYHLYTTYILPIGNPHFEPLFFRSSDPAPLPDPMPPGQVWRMPPEEEVNVIPIASMYGIVSYIFA